MRFLRVIFSVSTYRDIPLPRKLGYIADSTATTASPTMCHRIRADVLAGDTHDLNVPIPFCTKGPR